MVCRGCGKDPKDIQEYVLNAKVEGMTPEQFVEECEGTYDEATQTFYCTDCYIKAGMPIKKRR